MRVDKLSTDKNGYSTCLQKRRQDACRQIVDRQITAIWLAYKNADKARVDKLSTDKNNYSTCLQNADKMRVDKLSTDKQYLTCLQNADKTRVDKMSTDKNGYLACLQKCRQDACRQNVDRQNPIERLKRSMTLLCVQHAYNATRSKPFLRLMTQEGTL
jgi:hypothetical protein